MTFVIKCIWSLWFISQLVYGSEFSCPTMCTCEASYTSTNCQYNGLADLPEGLYSKTLHLDLSFNEFDKIPPNISSYKTLLYLNMSHNKLSRLEGKSLETLDSLKILDLSHNLFKDWLDINNATLINLPSLFELNLSHNPLKGFSDIFIDHSLRSNSLEKLVLINCSITNILDDILLGMSNLKLLILANNPLFTLNAQLKSPSLRHLDLTKCDLRKIHTDAITQLTSLETLILSKNFELKRFNTKSKSLKYLDLANCNIENIPSIQMPNVMTVILKNNHLRQLSSNNFISFPKLQNLDLSRNAIEYIDVNAFHDVKRIQNIDLSYNVLRVIKTETFGTNIKLQRLNLSRNYLSNVGQLVSSSLRMLDMSVCEIKEINKYSFIMMPKLQVLNLSRNFISYIPNNLRGDELQILDISMCGIFALNNQTFSSLKKLRNVNLAGNRLTSGIKPSFFYGVNEVKLEDNSWYCDCKSQEFFDMYVWIRHSVISTNLLRCRSPENLAGFTWEVACETVWRTYDMTKGTNAWIYSLSVVGLVTLLCCLVMALRQAHHRKVTRDQEEQEREREDNRERLRQIYHRNLQYSRESINRNAPDPRELQTPPSYMEAISMPRLNVSCSSLAGSHRSLHSLQSTNVEGSRRTRLRRKRPRNRQGSKCNISETQSAASLSRGNSDISNSEDELRPNTQENNAVIESSL
ncbi:hypothetical protein FQA39_LY15480 [Lamprigera yunnana]|nr:hypothetical protein FQA39_LY15480 [Lamprigera yunnana]